MGSVGNGEPIGLPVEAERSWPIPNDRRVIVTSCTTAEHYKWGRDCDGWILLPRDDLMVIQERMPPGTSEVRHFHSRARQFFYVLSGELEMELEGTLHLIPASHGIEIPPLARHRAANAGELEVNFVVISSPTTRGDRTECRN